MRDGHARARASPPPGTPAAPSARPDCRDATHPPVVHTVPTRHSGSPGRALCPPQECTFGSTGDSPLSRTFRIGGAEGKRSGSCEATGRRDMAPRPPQPPVYALRTVHPIWRPSSVVGRDARIRPLCDLRQPTAYGSLSHFDGCSPFPAFGDIAANRRPIGPLSNPA